jgi:hypothetical protein
LDRGESFRRVDIIGYSQGGTQAEKAATLALHGGYVRKLTKVCGTGEDLATAQFFAEMIDAKDPGERRYAFKARSIWQPDDRTHLAEDCELTIEAVRADQNRNPRVKQKIHWYSSTEVGEEKLQKPHAPGYSAQIVSEAFLSVVGGPHAEDVVADGHPYVYSTSTVTERGEVLAQLDNRPLEWEPTRKGLSSAIYGQSQSYFVDHARILLNGSDDL